MSEVVETHQGYFPAPVPHPGALEACPVCSSEGTIEHLARELAGAKATISHMTEAMGWLSGHDRSGLDHLADAMRLAAQLDLVRYAHNEYEASLKRRMHGAVAASNFIQAVFEVLNTDGPVGGVGNE